MTTAGALLAGDPEAPLVVLIHGLAGSHQTWDRVVPLIEDRARVVAVDLPSTRSIEAEADAVAALIDRPAIVVGHSRGGLVATAVAERHPGRVARIIAICTPYSVESRLASNGLTERVLRIPVVGDLAWALAGDGRRRAGLASAFAPGVPVDDRFVTALERAGRRGLNDASAAIDRYLAKATLAQRIRALPVDVELVFGDRDARVSRPTPDLPAHRLLTGVGHTPPWESPEDVARMIRTAVSAAGLPATGSC
jgi:pimeloyl-ACP methyl ester carboxylesterase